MTGRATETQPPRTPFLRRAYLRALADDLIDVKVEGDTATVNFKQSALEILNTAAARQLLAKAPIEKTLLQFPEIKKVQYAMDGKVFIEWDA